MSAKRAFLLEIVPYLQASTASTYFISGIPGSGNTDLLKYVRDHISKEIRQTAVLGVYKPTLSDLGQFLSEVGQDLMNAGFLTDHLDSEDLEEDLSSFWQWVREHHCFPRNQSLVIFIDLNHVGSLANASDIGQFFSSLRALAASHKMGSSGFQLHHVVTGFWQHVELDRYYRDDTSISFPYTIGVNYCHWKGLGIEEITQLLPDQPYRSLRGQLLHELTDGYAAAIPEILANLPQKQASMRNVMTTAKQIASHGESSKLLVEFWKQLPPQLFHRIKLLLQYQRLPYNKHHYDWEMLNEAGIVNFSGHSPARIVEIRSWFVELVLRLQWSSLTEISALETKIDHMIPQLQTFNSAAYEMIYEMETAARNVIALMLNQVEGRLSLEGKVIKRNQRGDNEDLECRALAAKDNAENSTHEAIAHPLTAYTQLRDLGDLYIELGKQSRNEKLKAVGATVTELSTVRNQVMHNQIVGDETLSVLERLRTDLFQQMAALAYS